MSIDFMHRFDNSFYLIKCYKASHKECFRHSHMSNTIEFVYITEGAAKHILNDSESIIEKGDYFAVDVSSEHEFPEVFSKSIDMIICSVNTDFFMSAAGKARNLNEIFKYYFPSTNVNIDKNKIYHDNDGSVFSYFNDILNESALRLVAYTDKISSLLVQILISMLRSYNLPREKNIDFVVEQVLDFVNKNFSGEVSLLELSKQFFISHSALSQNFKREVGTSFNTYLRQRRIFEACTLLQKQNVTVEEIASKVGYSDTKYFREVFKKILGCTPREFRGFVRKSQMCPHKKNCFAENRHLTCSLQKYCTHD